MSSYSSGFEEKVLQALGMMSDDITGLKSDVSDLKSDVRRLEVLHEETDDKIDHIIEVISGHGTAITQSKSHQQFQDEQLLIHERRLNALENKAA